jgi:uncharacterized LabA/DUF88 family protein
MQSFFKCDGEINFPMLKQQAVAKRVFFYDCLDDLKRPGESEPDFHARVAAQESLFDSIRELPGFHVRLGTLRGAPKKPRQKEVDVLLAVDMLTHGFDGNMEKAILIAGDLDFRPIVEALVRRGVFVEVWYDKRSIAHELSWAADFGREMDFFHLHSWSTEAFKSGHPTPGLYVGPQTPPTATGEKIGTVGDSPAHLSLHNGRYYLQIDNFRGGVHTFADPDLSRVELLVEIMAGPVRWK